MMSCSWLLAALSAFTVTNAAYDGPVRTAGATRAWSGSDEFNGSALDPAQVEVRHGPQQAGLVQRRAAILFGRPAENLRVANGLLTIEARHESSTRAFPDWGGQNYTSAQDLFERRGLDLRLLRNPGQAALRPGHLAGDLDASRRHEEMAGRRRNRHHGAGRGRAEPDLCDRSTRSCSTIPSTPSAARRSLVPDELHRFPSSTSSTGGRTRSPSASTAGHPASLQRQPGRQGRMALRRAVRA